MLGSQQCARFRWLGVIRPAQALWCTPSPLWCLKRVCWTRKEKREEARDHRWRTWEVEKRRLKDYVEAGKKVRQPTSRNEWSNGELLFVFEEFEFARIKVWVEDVFQIGRENGWNGWRIRKGGRGNRLVELRCIVSNPHREQCCEDAQQHDRSKKERGTKCLRWESDSKSSQMWERTAWDLAPFVKRGRKRSPDPREK